MDDKMINIMSHKDSTTNTKHISKWLIQTIPLACVPTCHHSRNSNCNRR